MPTLFKKKKKTTYINIRSIIHDIVTNRIVILGIILAAMFSLLLYRLFVLQIVEGEEHLSNFNYKVEKTIKLNGTRGNIYDCNGKLLAYNQLAYTVTMSSSEKNREIAEQRSEETGKTVTVNDVLNENILNLINLLEEHGDEVLLDLPIVADKNGKLKFSLTGASLTRFKKDVFAITNIDNLTGEDRKKAEGWLNSSPEAVYEYMRTGKDGPTGSGSMFGISDKYSMKDTLKIMSVRYDLYMNRYSQTKPITVATNISEKSIAALSESADRFPGVSIEADSLRKYNDAEYFAGIIGYTGAASESELSELNTDDEVYEASDVVGKTGIEKSMESELRGHKGEQDVLVDNLGKVIKVVKTTKASAGNDIYLTIDSELQKYAYNILERRLAGILLAHLTESDDPGKENMIPIKNVFFALIDNNVIDITHFSEDDATKTEKEVYSLFRKKRKTVLSQISKSLMEGETSQEALPEERQEYLRYVYSMLVDDEVLNTSLISENDAMFQRWKNGTVSLRGFLRHAVNNEWIDINVFDISSDYYNADKIYNELVEYVGKRLKKEADFDKILYKYMIKKGTLKGKKVCLLLYSQGVLDKEKDKDYNSLYSGSMSAYTFMHHKIEELVITPAQLALDPCSGSVIITDPDDGRIKAMVSYPSYNNNKLANGIDATYFAQLNDDKSSPMLNRCTQTRTAPGSTFKPISATAALEEGIATGDTYVKCTGVFDKITPNAKCWIYPSTHGNLNVSGAIAESCNYFFYQMGYTLGSSNGNYNSEKGLKRLKKYAELYGMDRKSGIEITEYEPKISDEDAVRSAIGQGTHNYTPSQIARYLTSLVNEKELLKLSLVERVMNPDGEFEQEYRKRVAENLEVSENTHTLIKIGMRDVVYGRHSSINFLFKNQGLKVAGKTGTAQENKNRPNHALFISYAPFDQPDITMTVVVPNGYTSSNAAEIARDIYKYYFGKADDAEKKGKKALIPTGSDGSQD